MPGTRQPGVNASLSEVLDQMWIRFLPDIRDRISVLDSAATAAAANRITAEQREAAHSAAHKLAGVLGTFGLAEGTGLARKFEMYFSPGAAPDPEFGKRLAGAVAELRTMIENRRPGN